MTRPPTRKTPRKKAATIEPPPETAAPEDPVYEEIEAELARQEGRPVVKSTLPPVPPADPAHMAVLTLLARQDRLRARRQTLSEEGERLQAEWAAIALELHQRSIAPLGAPLPPLGPMPPGELAKTFGNNVRLARLELRLSQDELAGVSGIGRKQISAIENGANTTIETIERLAKHLNRTPSELLTKR